ncbi:MAG: O-antigen ligase family protein [Bacteroidota bacterium]
MRPQQKSLTPYVAQYSMLGMVLLAAVLVAMVISSGQIAFGAIAILAPLAIAAVVLVFYNPYIGFFLYINYCFIFIGINRYIPDVPLGLTVDAILLLTTLSMFSKVKWQDLSKMHNGIFYVSLIWLVYTLIQIANPEITNRESMFYAIRGLSVYSIQVVVITLLWLGNKKYFNNFINLILIWSVFSTLWGLRQIWFGPDNYEYIWLERGGKITHILNGRLRAFSFYSDAGQYGTTMAFTSLLALILSLGPYPRKTRLIYAGLAIFSFIGFSISGSRGPLFVILFGFVFYLLLIKKFRMLMLGGLVFLVIFSFLKFSTIGSGNYQIFRLRTALDPNDASLVVRMQNQRLIRKYLESRPFGAGIGTTDTWAKKYYPDSFLANVPTDSWFISIWAQNGIIGLFLHVFSLAYVLVFGYANVNRTRSPDLRVKLIALYGGFFGVIIASLGNPIFGQSPIGALMYVSMTYLCIAGVLDEEFVRDEELLALKQAAAK